MDRGSLDLRPRGRVTVKSAAYECNVQDLYIDVDSSGGAVPITLPNPAAARGLTFIVKDTGGAAGANHITVTPKSGTIDGAGSLTLGHDYDSIIVYSDGSNYFCAGEYSSALGSLPVYRLKE